MAQHVTTSRAHAEAVQAGEQPPCPSPFCDCADCFPQTVTNWCARLANGVCVGVVYPYLDGFAVANLHYGGYPLKFETLDGAKNRVELRTPFIASWDEVEVAQ